MKSIQAHEQRPIASEVNRALLDRREAGVQMELRMDVGCGRTQSFAQIW